VVKRSSYSKPKYLTDGTVNPIRYGSGADLIKDDILWDVASNDDDLLGLDHVDRTRIARNGVGDLFLR
jgi:ubiquitin carboxyl-terminal hydrolase 7